MTVKTIISSLALLAVAQGSEAQTKMMTVNGLKVIFKPSPKQTVSAVMFFNGGTANYKEDQQGIENLALAATTGCGTEKYNKDAFKDIADKYGISLGGSSGYDFGYISMTCVKPYFNQGWGLFAQAITKPVFDEGELDILKQQSVANLKQEEGDPDSKLRQMAMGNTFKGTRYAYRPSGTVEGLEQFTRDQVVKHYATILNKSQMLLVVVGNIRPEELKAKVEQFLGSIPEMNASETKPTAEALSIKTNTNLVEDRELATNYIIGVMGAPKVSDPSFNAYRLAIDILSDKLFEEVRTKRNLSYAPAAFVRGGTQSYAGVYVTTTKPKEAITVMVNEVKRLKNGGFTAVELRDAKSQFATGYFMKNESNAAIAMALGAAELRGSWKQEEQFLDQINAVTLPEMQQTFAQYAEGIQWNYLGKKAEADKAAFEKKTN